MLAFIKASKEFIDIEEEIINSNSFFNLISKDKEIISKKEILHEIEQSERIGAHRYLIKDNQEYIGILEYLLLNPSDQCTWLGLLLIKNNLQSKGYGARALEWYQEVLMKQGIKKFRIGVIAGNEPALRFWKKQGFIEISRTSNEDHKTVFIYEKTLT